MWRKIIVIVAALIVFLLVAVNMHSTQVNLPFGKGFEVRTVFLLIISFLFGYGTAYLVGFLKNSKKRGR